MTSLPLHSLSGRRAYVPAALILAAGMTWHWLSLLLQGQASEATFFVYMLAMLAGAWAGYAPGLLITFLVFGVLPFLFRPGFTISQVNVVGLASLGVMSMVVSRTAAARRRAEAELRALNAGLEKRIEEKTRDVERASRMKDDFLATLSHELRTPLSAVLGYSQILSSGVLPPEQVRHALEAIRRNAMAQARLIEALLDLSRITAGTFELNLQQVELSSVVDAAVDVLKPEADRKGLAIDVTVPPIGLVADGARLQQVMWNLLSNAVKFTPLGGCVQVKAARKNDQVRIQVNDTGRGIAPDFLPHIFERFRQAEPRDSESVHGLGVGLTLVQEIVRAHKGAVAGESPGPGLGSTFTITLPLGGEAAPREPTPTRERETLPTGLPIDVLVVDDDDDGREMLALMLESWGAVVRKASSAVEALRAIGARRPDILLADLRMPGEDGLALIQKIRTEEIERDQPRLPAFAVTAQASAADRERALAAGFDGHVAKPLDPGELARVLAKARNA